jgi:hypothetical protein
VTVNKRKQGRRTVQEALQNNAWIGDITGPLTVPTIVQYMHLCERVEQVVLQQDIQDTFAWRWSASRVYLASSACAVLNLGQTLLLGAKEMRIDVGHPRDCRLDNNSPCVILCHSNS